VIRPAKLTLLLVILAVAGCAAPEAGRVASEIDSDAGGRQLPLTPAEREEQYRLAFAHGLRLVAAEQYGLAMGAFEQAAMLKPDSPEALFNLGACHEAIGDPVRAMSFYHRVLEMTPGDADCYANLGTCFIKMYHREKSPVWRKMAFEAWHRALELDPDHAAARACRARAERES